MVEGSGSGPGEESAAHTWVLTVCGILSNLHLLRQLPLTPNGDETVQVGSRQVLRRVPPMSKLQPDSNKRASYIQQPHYHPLGDTSPAEQCGHPYHPVSDKGQKQRRRRWQLPDHPACLRPPYLPSRTSLVPSVASLSTEVSDCETSRSGSKLTVTRRLGDLRERHRRRCEKSFDKGRSHKKKSCNLCARSKVKCDHALPACQRCIDRHTECEYPQNSTTATIPQWHESITASVPNLFDSYVTPDSAIANTQPQTAPDYIERAVADQEMNMDWEVELHDGTVTDFWNSSAWNLTPMEMEALSTNTMIQGPSTANVLLPETVPRDAAGQRSEDYGHPIGMTRERQPDSVNVADPNEKPRSPSLGRQPGSDSVLETLPNNINRKRNGPSENLETRVSSTAESRASRHVHVSNPSVSDSPSRRPPNPPISTSASSLTALSSPDASRRSSPGASNGSSEVDSPRGSSSSPRSVVSLGIQNTQLLGVSEIMKVICDYPKQMLRPNFWSPFVHHRHYRCSKGGLAEPIAIALCCVSANLQSVESSLPFLCKTINAERERLVARFSTKSENLEDAMAALHAMCIYQIETILVFRSHKSAKQRISSGELYHHFLLKMTRRLCQEHMERISLKDTTTVDWYTWTIAESLRRTTFLVNMVNELSYHTNALNPAYYEPLDPSLVLDLPLPAPETMWRALNEREWAVARDDSSWAGAGVCTLRDFTDRLDSGPSSADGSSPSQGSRWHNNIQQISNLIISSARRLKQQ
ncbi:MAG: hypothetical protein Q9215_004734 [Flavoplaca cf. flavocitrina]